MKKFFPNQEGTNENHTSQKTLGPQRTHHLKSNPKF